MAENKFVKEIHIGQKVIREGGRVFVIAEAGINHNGDIELAKRLVDMAVAARADAVKFQTFKAEEEVTKKLQKVEYQKDNEGDDESYFEMIKKLEFSEAQWRELIEYCKEKGIIFLSTPSEEVSARMLHRLGVSAFKIGSNDLVTTPMLEEIAGWGKPMILSTGMATVDEIKEALATVSAAGNRDIILLHCTLSYPTSSQDLNLRAIETLRETFSCLVGFSDHSGGVEAAPLAVALGAVVVETHITLDKTLPGPDQSMALGPHEFTALVVAIRTIEGLDGEMREREIANTPNAELMLGNAEKRPTPAELEMRKATRKGIVARRDIKKGEVIEKESLAFKRPYEGIPARAYREVIGKKAVADIAKDMFITQEFLI
ncbi:MAG: N-acetylneuraminate synthase family protein [Candidatus Uhrbacteria bacterium]|nr:N-acetylneuraminate synthase family protein [Candidatus Uhrbacteria bacterium]